MVAMMVEVASSAQAIVKLCMVVTGSFDSGRNSLRSG
jgi:hypothetical protein